MTDNKEQPLPEVKIVYDQIFVPTKNEPGGEYPSSVCDFDEDEQEWVPGDCFVKRIEGPVAIIPAETYHHLQSQEPKGMGNDIEKAFILGYFNQATPPASFVDDIANGHLKEAWERCKPLLADQSELSALRKEIEELKKERDIFRGNLSGILNAFGDRYESTFAWKVSREALSLYPNKTEQKP